MQITGWGKAVPDRVVTNAELAEKFDIDEEWIESRCGIRERRWVRDGETTASLAVDAGRAALEHAGLTADDIAHLVVATATPEQPSPATSAFVQHELGVAGSAHDVNAECSGFMYGLVHAYALMRVDPRPILLIGTDTHSLTANPEDRDLGILVGDGAGAVVLTPGESDWVLGWDLGAEGRWTSSLQAVCGGSRMPPSKEAIDEGLHYAKINGNEIYLNAVRLSVATARRTLDNAGVEVEDLALVIPHQANIRIINSIASHAGLDPDRVFTNLERYGNTASASIPIALDEAVGEGRIQQGDLIMLMGFGAGMTWGSMVLRWGGESKEAA
ncbi:3-oxoacyl-ACP synthase III family protein [Flexivirga meconopsidis]|uniref:3-oxoacyl-ACP synthase III family protein n=1 Tax=Flexivirga meconopsidis TaxID=2977121 RepID=UPI002240454D|nr:ketoacyl-ACP synthase III [Flexivirga meconopsidis]